MKKFSILFTIALFGCISYANAQVYKYSSGSVSFFSKTSMEDIDAHNPTPNVLINLANNTIAVITQNMDFKFQNKLMEEHYNEKYVESEKYPMAVFTGKIIENIDLNKDGVYTVNVAGKMKLHGVEKERTITGTITVKNGQIQLFSKFAMKCSDHNITIPSLIGAKVSDTVDATVDVILVAKK